MLTDRRLKESFGSESERVAERVVCITLVEHRTSPKLEMKLYSGGLAGRVGLG